MAKIVILVVLLGFIGFIVFLKKRVEAVDPNIGPQKKLQRAKTAQEFLGFDSIQGNMLVIDEHRYRAYLKVTPINFYLHSEGERDGIQASYKEALQTQNAPFEIFVPALRTDYRKRNTEIARRSQNMPGILPQYGAELSEFTNAWVANRYPLRRGYYIILQYNYTPEKGKAPTKQEIAKRAATELHIRATTFMESLGRTGLKVERMNSSEIANLIFATYNRDRSKSVDISTAEQDGIMTLLSTSAPKAQIEYEEGEGVPFELLSESEESDQSALEEARRELERQQQREAEKLALQEREQQLRQREKRATRSNAIASFQAPGGLNAISSEDEDMFVAAAAGDEEDD